MGDRWEAEIYEFMDVPPAPMVERPFWQPQKNFEIVWLDAIECKINSDHFDPANLTVFRSLYPEGRNYVLSPNIKTSYQRRYAKLQMRFISVNQISELKCPWSLGKAEDVCIKKWGSLMLIFYYKMHFPRERRFWNNLTIKAKGSEERE